MPFFDASHDLEPRNDTQLDHDAGGMRAVDRSSLSRAPWDQLSKEDRRRRLDAMEPDAVRSLAESMPLIEQAKGILMGCFGLDAASAFAALCRVSSSKNVKLRVLAAALVEAVSTDHPSGTGVAPPSPIEQVRLLLRDTRPSGATADAQHRDASQAGASVERAQDQGVSAGHTA